MFLGINTNIEFNERNTKLTFSNNILVANAKEDLVKRIKFIRGDWFSQKISITDISFSKPLNAIIEKPWLRIEALCKVIFTNDISLRNVPVQLSVKEVDSKMNYHLHLDPLDIYSSYYNHYNSIKKIYDLNIYQEKEILEIETYYTKLNDLRKEMEEEIDTRLNSI